MSIESREAYEDAVPANLRKWICRCESRSGFVSGGDLGFEPAFYVCADCKKIPALVILKKMTECDNCEDYYITRTWNDRNFLCWDCE